MFRCIQCGTPAQRLYITYSKGNLQLEQCVSCGAFVDTYVECDAVLVAIDMLLHKPQVFRHVLFNRRGRASQSELPRHGVDLRVARFGLLVVLFDVYTRLLRMEKAASAVEVDRSAAMYATRWATGALAVCGESGGAATAWGQQLATLAAPLLSLLPISDLAEAIQSAWVVLLPPQLQLIREVLSQYLNVLLSTALESVITFAVVGIVCRFVTWKSARREDRARPWARLWEASVLSSFGQLILILMVVWDPPKLDPENIAYVWLINAYVLFTNAQALCVAFPLSYRTALSSVIAANLFAHWATWAAVSFAC
ncbi:sterol homeostasis protein [Allomyces arbusculus]|nr:sterol homeostasis protein [Allomyces arbusculus]